MEENIQEFLNKVKDALQKEKFDLSSAEDLSIAIMNLIAIEEHIFFTYAKTHKKEYLDLLNEVRELRKKFLSELVKEEEGEVWCISKHLLSASMRLIEVGTKHLSEGEKEKATTYFEAAYRLYTIFWQIVLKIVKTKEEVKEAISNIQKERDEAFSKILNELLNCCEE